MTTRGRYDFGKIGATSLDTLTSAELAAIVSDETGSGALVFGTAPTFTTNITTPIIKPAADGTTAVQVTKADGSTQVIGVDTTNSRAIVGTGTSTADFAVKPDTDATVYLGRAAIGSPGSDVAYFSHYDMLTTGNYALRQDSFGVTTLNAASGSSIYLSLTGSAACRLNSTGFGIGTTSPWTKLSVADGDVAVRDVTDLASESLTNGALTAGTSWTQTNDCALAGDAATWTYSAGTASTLTQASATLAIAGKANRWYYLTYTVSGASGSPTASITTAFASTSTALTLTNGAKTLTFESAAVPGDFVITSTLTAGQAFTIDTLVLKEIIGGDVMAHGDVVTSQVRPHNTATPLTLNAAGGLVVAGADGTVCGNLTLWDGAGGNTPGYVKVCSPNGTAWYLFVEDDGTIKVHNAVPTANTDGSVVGSQT